MVISGSTGRDDFYNQMLGPDRNEFHCRLSDRVCDYVINSIFIGQLKQGQKIVEAELARVLAISTAPVREALIQLDVSGWIKRVPNCGTCVNDFSQPDHCSRLYRLRLAMETGVFYQLASVVTESQLQTLEEIVTRVEDCETGQRLSDYRYSDVDFHLTVANFACGRRMVDMLRPVLMQLFVSVLSSETEPKDLDPEYSHRVLLEGIASRQPGRAAELISGHIHSQAKIHGVVI